MDSKQSIEAAVSSAGGIVTLPVQRVKGIMKTNERYAAESHAVAETLSILVRRAEAQGGECLTEESTSAGDCMSSKWTCSYCLAICFPPMCYFFFKRLFVGVRSNSIIL